MVHQPATTLSQQQTVTLIATQDYGNQLLFTKEASFSHPTTALHSLQQVAKVNTTYGGGFVNAINGISSTFRVGSDQPQDWLFYVNGILSPIGSQYYQVHEGDVIHWDYHYWSDTTASTAIIGEFPEPFLHGFQGNTYDTSLVYTQNVQEIAQQLRSTLVDYGIDALLVSIDELTKDIQTTHNLILIGTIEGHPLISDIMADASDIGLFIRWEESQICTYDALLKCNQRFAEAGCVIAMQNHWNPKGNMHGENVIWMITGSTVEQVQQACFVLCEQPDAFVHAASAIIVEGEIVKVP